MIDNVVKFSYTSYNEDGDIEREIEHTFSTEGFLPDMLRAYKDFLQGVSFNYVKEIYAVKDDEGEVGEEG